MNKTLKTYKKLCTEFYDLELDGHENTKRALSFYMDYATSANGPILEPMCGTGRFLIPMLKNGLDIEGFDASPEMLKALEEKYSKISSNQPPVWEEFVENFSSNKKYNLIFVPFGSWGLITDIENSKKCLDIMHKHLAPNGKFVIEIETIASIPECGIVRRSSHTRKDGSILALSTFASYQPKTQIFSSVCRYESFVKDKLEAIETENFEQYLYRFDEMDLLLKNAGFTQIKKYSDFSKTPANNPNAPILIYECSR